MKGKIAVVTGGTGVLGSNVSKGLLEAGATVVVVGSRQETVDKALDKLRDSGDVYGMACNVLEPSEIEKVCDFVMEKWGRVDILVNAAGGNVPGATIMDDQHVWDMKKEDLNKVIDLNLYGTIYPCITFGKIMAQQKSGSIINVSSMAAYDSLTRVMGYAIAKEGVIALTKWLAQEMAIKYSEKIRVNAIAPGPIERTGGADKLWESEEQAKRTLDSVPLKRLGTPEEIADLAVFMLSDKASYLNGECITLDGGQWLNQHPF